MDKVVTIQKHLQNKPNEKSEKISWFDFVHDMQFQNEAKMNEMAFALLRGEFLYSMNGFTYFILGVETIEVAD